ncbi:MAG: homoserine O-acetyltransferase [Actinobacteria bacterium]|nr:homoserine O-acetyltransferase [Actinomycetota bacterium]
MLPPPGPSAPDEGDLDPAFQSSDSVRGARPLRHARSVTFAAPFALERGQSLPEVTVVYETYGTLNAERDNAVLVCHAISGDSHVARHGPDDDPGWWDVVVGPGAPIDTDHYFVICPNILGGCRGTTGPNSRDPGTGHLYGPGFPAITIGDIVELQRRLIDHLGIDRLLGVVGGSMGGHQTLWWATHHPARVAGALAIATSPRLTSQALAFDVVGRNAILRDPNYRGEHVGDGNQGPTVGLAIARMLGHITYLSRAAMTDKFDADRFRPRDIPTEFETRFSVGSYLAYQGERFVERFDANSYIALSLAMDRFDLGATPEALAAALAPSACRWLVLSFSSDWLFPPEQSRQIVGALLATGKAVTYCNVDSTAGHDAFLLPDDLPRYGELLRAFLATTWRAEHARGQRADEGHDPGSIFHAHRLDYDVILDLIPPDANVLDLGCGNGGLLRRLGARGHARCMGVELSEPAIIACAQRGLDVVQADLNDGLGAFGAGQFDVVVLSHTLQAVRNVVGVMDEILRVGRRCIVSFPNFAYRRLLAEGGRAPVSTGLLQYQWYDTPNMRFLSIADFEAFCRAKGIRVHRALYLDTESDRVITADPNINADMAVVVISR